MSDADKVNILIVDDLPEKILVIRSILDDLGENILTAYSGTDALRLVLDHEFAVILLDVNMPDIDGLETAALIRKRKRTAHTPIIFVTAFADEMHTAQGYSLGAVDYILSPVVPAVLRTKVKVFVDLFRMNQQVKRQAEERISLAREQAARAAAEEATRRSNFLARASTALATSLGAEGPTRTLLTLVVPDLADVAGVTLVGEPGQPWETELAWVVPNEPRRVHTGRLTGLEAPHDVLQDAVDRALADGAVQVVDNLEVPYPPEILASAPAGQVLRSALVLPLQARGRTLGALTLAAAGAARRLSASDRTLAEDLAGRAAVAFDNNRLYQSLQQADRHKDEFLAMLAHELRNPLAPIRNATEVMRLVGNQDAVVVQARDMIDRQVKHMARLVDDLLDTSRISRGKILLRKESIDLVKLVRDVADDTRPELANAGLTLELRLADGPIWCDGDPTRLAQVVGNVLHNARKFTDAGGRVTVELQRDGATSVRITVRDTGIGMEPAMLSRVFESFTQADRSLDRSRGGLGLGLALVKGLVELHGGRATAHSAGPGQGTELSIWLPIRQAPMPIPERAAGPAAGAGPCRVLIIEDNVDAAVSMQMLLSQAGHHVQVATSGPAGVQAVLDFGPDVVLCDLGLPGGMDGYAVAQTLRRNGAGGPPLLVALTGYGQEEDKQRSYSAGFDAHLTKPVEFQELQRLMAARGPRVSGGFKHQELHSPR